MLSVNENARFHAEVDSRILGFRLVKIKFDYHPDVINSGEWVAAWSLCSNLEMLHTKELSAERKSVILGTPKHDLKELRICSNVYNPPPYDGENDSYAKEIMDIIAEGTMM